MPFLRNEFLKILTIFFTMALFTEGAHIYDQTKLEINAEDVRLT